MSESQLWEYILTNVNRNMALPIRCARCGGPPSEPCPHCRDRWFCRTCAAHFVYLVARGHTHFDHPDLREFTWCYRYVIPLTGVHPEKAVRYVFPTLPQVVVQDHRQVMQPESDEE